MSAITIVLLAIALVAWGALLGRTGLVVARMFQIEEYEAKRLWRWSAQPRWLGHMSARVVAPLTAAGWIVGAVIGDTGGAAFVAFVLGGVVVANALWGWNAPKKELVFTPRMRRLLTTAAILALGLLAAIAALYATARVVAMVLFLVLAGFFPAVAVGALVLANLINFPIEARVRRGFLSRAEDKISRLSPQVVAVAGSYGKTSTKHLLAQALATEINVLPTPKSFNTLMGVSKTINEDLSAEHRVFIVEMDAYARGEIAQISHLAKPRYAILTAVGPQHLERFGAISAIADALFEVVEALPADGSLVIYGGEEQSAALAQRAELRLKDVVRYGLAGEAGRLDVAATDVVIGGDGSTFLWQWPARSLQAAVRLQLLGRHQVLNATAALAMAVILGVKLESAVRAVEAAQAVDHRLQPLPAGGGLKVIDDSFNANPVGVHNALEVLAEIHGGQRILVTPGMVELGSVEEAENLRYGVHAAAVCDHVILVEAKPGLALLQGLRQGGMAEERIHLVNSLNEATVAIRGVARAGDVVLFANDLPDTY